MSAGDVRWRYIEDHMGTSIGRLLGTSSGLPWDVILPIGYYFQLQRQKNSNRMFPFLYLFDIKFTLS